MSGYVYAIRIQGTNMFKLGYSLFPSQRLASLQTASPFPLEITHQFAGGPEHEAMMHRALVPYRVRAEWFELDPQVVIAVMNAGATLAEVARPPFQLPSIPGCEWKAAGKNSYGLFRRWSEDCGNGKKRKRRAYIGCYSKEAIAKVPYVPRTPTTQAADAGRVAA